MSTLRKIVAKLHSQFRKQFWNVFTDSSKVETLFNKVVCDSHDFFQNFESLSLAQQRFDKLYATDLIYKYKGTCLVDINFGWVIESKNKLIEQSNFYHTDPWRNTETLPSINIIFKILLTKKALIVGKYVFLGPYKTFSNYFHFLIDVIPLYYLIKNYQIKHNLQLTYILDKRVLDLGYVKEYFSILDDLKVEKWLFVNESVIKISGELFFGKSSSVSSIHLDLLNTKVLNNTQLSNTFLKRIFIQRAKNRKRHLVNISEVKPILDEYRFTIIDLDGLSVKEQISLFKNAEIIIGIHGAGLANLVYSEYRKSTILELFPGEKTPGHYKRLAELKEINYYRLKGQTLNKVNDHFKLEPNALYTNLKRIIDNDAT